MYFHDNSFNQYINNSQDDNYLTISNLYSVNPNEPKLEDSNVLNDFFNLSKSTQLDGVINNIEPSEKQNLQVINENIIKNSSNKLNNTASTYPVEIEQYINNLKSKCHIDLKRKRDDYNKHDKFADDNLRRKTKNLVLKYTLKFLNTKIKDMYQGNIGNGIIRKELVPLHNSIKNNATIGFNKKLIYKTLKDIFSENISSRFKAFSFPNKNEIIIKKLLNDKDENRRLFFQKLFNITFIQCIEVFSGTKNYEELKGFAKFDDIKKEFDDEHEYIEKIEYYLINFENLIKERKGRTKKNKKNQKEKGLK